jgi:hypothetical protein
METLHFSMRRELIFYPAFFPEKEHKYIYQITFVIALARALVFGLQFQPLKLLTDLY